MRLEFEPTVSTLPARPVFLTEEHQSDSDDFQNLLQRGIAAAKDGKREDARAILMEASELDSFSEDVWMWLASISDYPEELLAFLNNVLTINPENERARTWLAETESLLLRSCGDTETDPSAEAIEPVGAPSAFHVTAPPRRTASGDPCPFCAHENDPGAFDCGSCRAVLTMADIEKLLSNSTADASIIRDAVAEMESEWDIEDLNEKELTALGLGHLNVKNFDEGLRYFHELLRQNPNNVVLAGQLNAIAIRLEEMRRQSEIAETKPKGKTILVVDDSATVRKLLASKLEKSGHNVVCAIDGVDALAKLAESAPDMIFLDIAMPRMDGYAVCKEIRANPTHKNLPVVMISGKDGFFDKVRGKMAGASGYVTKPFGPEILMKTLETHLSQEVPLSE